MTPEEAVRHEFLQPSGNTSYNHTKSMRPENAENHLVSPKSSAPKYGRPPHLTPNSVLPDIKSATINKYTTKSYKERTKSKGLFRIFVFIYLFIYSLHNNNIVIYIYSVYRTVSMDWMPIS